jgi:3-oxoacyl-[acyl-carrier protein] reductase
MISVLRQRAKEQEAVAAQSQAAGAQAAEPRAADATTAGDDGVTPTLAPELVAAFSLAGRVAIVTGGARGIGAGIGRALALAGATVVLADVESDSLATTAESIGAAGGRATGVRCDVSSRAEVDALVAGVVATHGRLDVMVNNAGIIVNNRVVDTPEEELDRVLGINLKGAFFGCQAAVRAMLPARRGSIVNIASQAIDSPAPGIVSYAMSKAAIAQLTRTLAVEVGADGIRVNAVAPGFVPTPMTNRHFTAPDGTVDEAVREQVHGFARGGIPLRTLGEPEDMAYAVLYLASDAAKFVTGQVLRPNGGGAMA